MARRPQLTDAGLLAESFGTRPYTVTVREEKEGGANVILDYSLAGQRRKRTLGYPVRRRVGRRWEWDHQALDRAREAAEDKSAELRLARTREEVLDTGRLTFGEAVAMYTAEDRGGLPPDRRTRAEYRRVLGLWTKHFGADTTWSWIRRNDVEARVRELVAAKKVPPSAQKQLAVLQTLHGWLTNKAQIDGLANPVQGFDWKKLRESHQVARPRFTPEEVAEIVKVRHDVDPRFALFLGLMDDSGARSKAVRILMRSAVDREMDHPPTAEQAPYGWVLFPALKGQRAPLHLLTAFERRELEIGLLGLLEGAGGAVAGRPDRLPAFPRLEDQG